MIRPSKLKKSFSSHVFEKKRTLTPSQSPYFRREALKLSEIPQVDNEEDYGTHNKKRDSFENSLENVQDEDKEIRRNLYENLTLVLNYKENVRPKRFIFARDNDENSEDEEENQELYKLDYVDYYELKYEEFQRDNDNQDNLYIMKKDPFELLQHFSDPYYCLELRKKILFIKYLTTFIASKITQNPLFDSFMLIVILFNCIILAMMDPKSQDSTLNNIDDLLVIVYTIEMGLKMLANGLFFGKKAYFKGAWNILDFLIIATAYLPIIFSYEVKSFNLSSLRTIRVLRPLRTITSMKSLKVVVGTLFSSIPLLLDTITILLIFFNIFSIAGLQLFSGVLKQRCFNLESGMKYKDKLCGYEHCEPDEICGKMIASPKWGVLNFDNFFYSFLMVFKCINLQGWSTLLLYLIETFSIFVEIYFILLIYIGSFFLLSLTLAVIKAKYTDNVEKKSFEIDNNADLAGNSLNFDIDLNELKLLKKLERAHFKRMKQKKEVTLQKKFTKQEIPSGIRDHSLQSFEFTDLPQKILSQRARESLKKVDAMKRLNLFGNNNKSFPLSELIMKRLVKNNQRLLKHFFQMKHPFIEKNEDWKKNKFIIKMPTKALNFFGMKNIFTEEPGKKNMFEPIRRGFSRFGRASQLMDQDDFIVEMEKTVPKKIEVRPEIPFKLLTKSSVSANRMTTTNDDEIPFMKNDVESLNSVQEPKEDSELLNMFNDPFYQRYYKETGILWQYNNAYKNNNKINVLKIETQINEPNSFNPEIVLNSPTEAKQSALDKFLKNPNSKANFSLINRNTPKSTFSKKMTLTSPEKLEFSPDKRSVLGNFSSLFASKKRTNLRNYKIMVDFNKKFRSNSESDVLENQVKSLAQKKREALFQIWKNRKFNMVYNRQKKNINKENSEQNKLKCIIHLAVKKVDKNKIFHKYNQVLPFTSMERTSELQTRKFYQNGIGETFIKGSESPRSRRKKFLSHNLKEDSFVLNYELIKKKFNEKIVSEQHFFMENQEIFNNILVIKPTKFNNFGVLEEGYRRES